MTALHGCTVVQLGHHHLSLAAFLFGLFWPVFVVLCCVASRIEVVVYVVQHQRLRRLVIVYSMSVRSRKQEEKTTTTKNRKNFLDLKTQLFFLYIYLFIFFFVLFLCIIAANATLSCCSNAAAATAGICFRKYVETSLVFLCLSCAVCCAVAMLI